MYFLGGQAFELKRLGGENVATYIEIPFCSVLRLHCVELIAPFGDPQPKDFSAADYNTF